MPKQIFFQSDWWLHLLSALAVWGIAYFVETKFLKRKFAAKKVLFQLLAANIIDLDHLFAASVFVPGRCSINNHAFHSFFSFPVYLFGLFTRYRYFFIGVFLHLLIDYFGCLYIL